MSVSLKVDALIYCGLAVLCVGVGFRYGADMAAMVGGLVLLTIGIWLARRL